MQLPGCIWQHCGLYGYFIWLCRLVVGRLDVQQVGNLGLIDGPYLSFLALVAIQGPRYRRRGGLILMSLVSTIVATVLVHVVMLVLAARTWPRENGEGREAEVRSVGAGVIP
jgi:hypothetical protein